MGVSATSASPTSPRIVCPFPFPFPFPWRHPLTTSVLLRKGERSLGCRHFTATERDVALVSS